MAEESKSVEALEAQMSAVSDTQSGLAGLIEKMGRVQAELQTGGFDEFSEALSEPFSAMSGAAEKLQEIHHTMEIERNRIRNEA